MKSIAKDTTTLMVNFVLNAKNSKNTHSCVLTNVHFKTRKAHAVNALYTATDPDMKEKVKKVMRYSGPRMLLPHPTLALHHAWDSHRKPPTLAKKTN